MSESAAELAQLVTELASEPSDATAAMHDIIVHTLHAAKADGTAIMIRHRKRIEVAAASTAEVRHLDELQITTGQGPGLAAFVGGPPFTLIMDNASDSRWPAWSRRVATLGWRSALSLQLANDSELLGVLDLYARDPGHFDEDDADTAGLFAPHACIALANALQVSDLRKAITSRHLIGQAQGILMERFDINADQSFNVLRRYSQDRNLKLRSVAEYVIEHRRLPN